MFVWVLAGGRIFVTSIVDSAIASQSKQTVRGGPKPAKVGLHRRLHIHQSSKLKIWRLKLTFGV
jgi:hypothetical protein